MRAAGTLNTSCHLPASSGSLSLSVKKQTPGLPPIGGLWWASSCPSPHVTPREQKKDANFTGTVGGPGTWSLLGAQSEGGDLGKW